MLYNTSGFWPRVRARALRAPVFLGSLPRQTGRCAPPPPRPLQLRCFLFYPQKYIKSVKLGPPTSRAFFFPQEHRGYEIWGPPVPRIAHRSFADPSGNILGSKLCTGATIRPKFFLVFLFYSFWIFSFYYSLPFLLSFSISSYSSLLILLVGAIPRLPFLLLLYFKLFVDLQTCILIIYVHISVILRVFFIRAKPVLSSYFYLLYFVLPLLILLFLYLNCLLY